MLKDAAAPGRSMLPNAAVGVLKFAPFVASTGYRASLQVTAGDLTCYANVSVSEGQSDAVYTLMAYNGQYDAQTDFYQEHFCSLYRYFSSAPPPFTLLSSPN